MKERPYCRYTKTKDNKILFDGKILNIDQVVEDLNDMYNRLKLIIGKTK